MGERAKSIGEEAEDKVWKFLDSLQYSIQETNNEKYDIDCIAKSPPKNPKYGLAKPRYAPNGLTAFEVTEPILNKKKVNNFRKKILKYNRENPERKLKGVYLVDRRISPKMLKFMKNRQIWGWGVRRQRLYREKANAFNYWFRKGVFITEIPIDDYASCLHIPMLPPLKSKHLLHFAVFLDDITHKLTMPRVKEVMNWIKTKSISPLIELGMRPICVYFEFFSIGGLSKYLKEETYKVVKRWEEEEHISVMVYPKKDLFTDFRAFTTL